MSGFTVILPEFRKDIRLRNFAINDSALLSYTTRWKPYLGHVSACHFALGYRLMSSYFRKNLPSPRWTACIGVLIVLRTKTNVLECPDAKLDDSCFPASVFLTTTHRLYRFLVCSLPIGCKRGVERSQRNVLSIEHLNVYGLSTSLASRVF